MGKPRCTPCSWASNTCAATQCTYLAEGCHGLLRPLMNKSDGAEHRREGTVLRGWKQEQVCYQFSSYSKAPTKVWDLSIYRSQSVYGRRICVCALNSWVLPNFPSSVKAPSPTVVSTTAAVTQGQLSSGALAKADAQPQHGGQSPGTTSQGTPAGVCPTWGNLSTSVCTGAIQPKLLLWAVGRHGHLQGTVLPSVLLQQAWGNRSHLLSQKCPLLCPL